MKLTRITDIRQTSRALEMTLEFQVDGRARGVGDVNRSILHSGWVRLGGLTDEELAHPRRPVIIKSGNQDVHLSFDAAWSDDPQVLYLVRRWLRDMDDNRLPMASGPYDPGVDGPILE